MPLDAPKTTCRARDRRDANIAQLDMLCVAVSATMVDCVSYGSTAIFVRSLAYSAGIGTIGYAPRSETISLER